MPQSGTKRSCSFILIVCPAQTILSRSPTVNAQAHFSTQPSAPLQGARFSHANENQERKGCVVPSPRQRTQARFREARLPGVVSPAMSILLARPAVNETSKKVSQSFPRDARLLKHA